MWLTTVIVLIAVLDLPLLGRAEEQPANDQTLSLETFDADQPRSFPGQWVVRGDDATAKAVYSVAEEGGNRFLRAYADQQDVQIGISRPITPKQFPVLQWRWRVKQLPSGADERVEKTNDSAAAVYVVFDSTLLPRAIKYVWSAVLPVGTRMRSPVYWRSRVVVLQSGMTRAGEWQQEAINYAQDYKEFFGEEPGKVIGIAILTDSDSTKSVAEANYDDFSLLTDAALATVQAKNKSLQIAPAMVGGQ
jgi:hypothetical protein